jgi:hypothetical protein
MVYANTGLRIRNLLLLVQIQLLLVQKQVCESKTRFCDCAKLNDTLSLAKHCLTGLPSLNRNRDRNRQHPSFVWVLETTLAKYF